MDPTTSLIRRRSLLGAAAALTAGAPLAQPAAVSPVLRFAVSSYSYWHFKRDRYPIEKVIDEAARLSFDGVEILHRQMADESPETLNRLKRAALLNGLSLVMFSIHQDFVSLGPMSAARLFAIPNTASIWR